MFINREILIRIAEKPDSADLVDFNQAMALETEGKKLDSDVLRRGVEAVFADEKKGFYVVAEGESKIVGGLMITFEWSDWRNNWFWWIQSVYILPDFRGQGIYRKLAEFVEEKAKQQGDVVGIRLYVERENAGAQAVYEKLRMEQSHYLMYEQIMDMDSG